MDNFPEDRDETVVMIRCIQHTAYSRHAETCQCPLHLTMCQPTLHGAEVAYYWQINSSLFRSIVFKSLDWFSRADRANSSISSSLCYHMHIIEMPLPTLHSATQDQLAFWLIYDALPDCLAVCLRFFILFLFFIYFFIFTGYLQPDNHCINV